MDKKNLSSVLPFISIILIVAGFIRSIVFYKYFNIRINDFLSFDEILMMILDELVYVVLVFIPILFFSIKDELHLRIIKEKMRNSNNTTQLLPNETTAKSQFQIGLYLLILSLISLILFFVFHDYKDKIFFLFVSIIFIVSYMYKILSNLYFDAYKKHLNKIYGNTILMVVILLASLSIQSSIEASSVMKGKYVGSKIITKDFVYYSTPEKFYIGKTGKYSFIYNKLDSSFIALSASEIISIEIKSKKF